MKTVIAIFALAQIPFVLGIAVGIGVGPSRPNIEREAAAQLQTLQSALDHERNYTALLSRIIADREREKQMEGIKP